jgi:hypothetical protein
LYTAASNLRNPGLAGKSIQCPRRVDIMTRPRDMPEFPEPRARRTTITDERGEMFDLLAVEDLVQAKKLSGERTGP